MDVTLEVRSGDLAGKRVTLRPGQSVRVGRAAPAALVGADDALLSGVHFAVECADSGCRLRDLGSRFGTFRGGERVTEADLRDGDQLTAGRTTFAVRLAGATPSSPAAPPSPAPAAPPPPPPAPAPAP